MKNTNKVISTEKKGYKCSGNDNLRSLAFAIISQAIRDYEIAIEFQRKKDIEELENFFRSDWCNALMFIIMEEEICYTGEEILELIEKNIDTRITKRQDKRNKIKASLKRNKELKKMNRCTEEEICPYQTDLA